MKQLSSVWLCVAVAVAMAVGCSGGDLADTRDKPGDGVYVPARWQTERAVSGHRLHVQGEKIACNKCHQLTEDKIGPVTPQACASCHEKEARLKHAAKQAEQRFGAGVKADCTQCHAFTDDGTGHPVDDAGAPFGPGDCARCHLKQQGDTPAVKVHGTSECTTCHKPHSGDKPKPGSCAECHGDISADHAAHGTQGNEGCTTCHQHQHAPASEALGTCVPCHEKNEPVVPKTALFGTGHMRCVGCHQPHAFKKTEPVQCRSCHESIAVLGAARVKQHAQCNSCHSPHDVRGTPDQACAKCHKDKHPDHPKHGVAGTCVGCHDPHPAAGATHTRARPCSSCHQTATADTSFHVGVACRQCHKPHEFVKRAKDRAVCQGCHAQPVQRVAKLAGHQKCASCHQGLPHRPQALRAGCETCHGAEQREVRKGHSACMSCHEPHAGTVGTECRSCHKEEHRTAPSGHQDCVRCHTPHTGAVAKAPCNPCHAEQAKTAHGKLGSGCTTCHRAHGPKGVAQPPACGSCHKPTTLAGLHKIDKHQDCSRCHSGHGPVQGAARQACLDCHRDRKDHFPEAPRCANCHLFTPNR